MDFVESFALHERTYIYRPTQFKFRDPDMNPTPDGYKRLDCDRCDFFENVTTKAIMTHFTMVQPVYIQTEQAADHYILCPSCRLQLKGKIREWVKTGNF